LRYAALVETERVRHLLSQRRHGNDPICPPDQGDFIYLLARERPHSRCLEIGFASGSTALYLLNSPDAHVKSIDYRQADYGGRGIETVKASGMGTRHHLIEENSNLALPKLLRQRERFDVIFLDGWKTFDHLSVDIYYCNQLLKAGGVMIFDDTRMPSVDRALRLLKTHYEYEEIDAFRYLGARRLSLWYLLTTKSLKRPYRGFRKRMEYEQMAVSRDWNFWRSF
jgi:predicted O-methyltransferase YrrM